MKRSFRWIPVGVGVYVFVSVIFLWAGQYRPPKQTTVSFLDVGQGDATLFRLASGEVYLVDCGKDAVILEALSRVLPWRARAIDTLIVTHPDLDHYGGCIDVLRRYNVKELIVTGVSKENNAEWQTFLADVDRENLTQTFVTDSLVRKFRDDEFSFLYPDHDLRLDSRIPGTQSEPSTNNTSIVFRFTCPNTSILMTGDMEHDLERYLVEKKKEMLRADVLKAGHHGSSGSTGEEFVATVAPADVVFSAGKKNRYGHPSRRVLARVVRHDAEVWRTDEMGDIHAVCTPEGSVIQ